jgi:hypothetical protein
MATLVGVFGFALDYTGESWLSISSRNWGLIGLVSFIVFVGLTCAREIEWEFQKKPKAELDIRPHYPAGNEIRLVVHNKTKVPVFVSANMTCKTISAPSGVSALPLVSAQMGWESSGSFRQILDPDDRQLLKLCQIDGFGINGHSVRWLNFYKIESDKLTSVQFMGAESILDVEVKVRLNASLGIKGQREWVFYVSFISASSTLAISSEQPLRE